MPRHNHSHTKPQGHKATPRFKAKQKKMQTAKEEHAVIAQRSMLPPALTIPSALDPEIRKKLQALNFDLMKGDEK